MLILERILGRIPFLKANCSSNPQPTHTYAHFPLSSNYFCGIFIHLHM